MTSLKKWFSRQPAIVITLLITFAGLLSYAQFRSDFLEIVELKTIDLRFRARGEIKPGSDVVLAVIDEKSLDQEGKWIWPRSKIAKLIDKLSYAGTRVIAFDIGFSEPDDRRVMHAIDHIAQTASTMGISQAPFNTYLNELKKTADNDRILAEAIKHSKAKVILGWFFHMDPDTAPISHLDPATRKQAESYIRRSRYSYTRSAFSVQPNLSHIEQMAPEPDIQLLAEATPYGGYFNFRPDVDGVIRWLPAVLKFNDNLYAPLSLMALSAYYGAPLYLEIGEQGEILETCIGDRICIPTDDIGRVMINYRGKDLTFKYISITDILNNRTPKKDLENKIVIVGATAIGTFDQVVSPFSTTFPGPEIHANVIDSILTKNFFPRPDPYKLLDVMAILFGGFLVGMVLSRFGVIPGTISFAALFAGYAFLCLLLFAKAGIVLNMVYPLLVMTLVYICVTAYKYFVEEGQKRFIRDAFSTYLAPAVVKQLIESPEKLVLGGENREITAFFSDVQSFTSISEKLSPQDLVELLNEFLTEMTDIILKHQGTVDKFEGDAIIAFFGAPITLENHCESAVLACIEMQKRMAQLRKNWHAAGKPELKMRIGLSSGFAVVGNMGSKDRMDYTMMGDTVNTAARLEGVNKIYGIYTLISETTRSALSERVVVREIDSINVVGKNEPVTVFEPLGLETEIQSDRLKTVDLYQKGLYAYRNREWGKAIQCFNDAMDITPEDGPSRVMLQRSMDYQASPPPESWNGAFTMLTK